MWNMWLINVDEDEKPYKRTVDHRLFGIETNIAEMMKNMIVGDTIYTNGYYEYQIIRTA